ncbi:MAG: cobalamin-binding protein [Nitrosopumilaceae archaeon]|nr:cobalamin-binding protein [Nitrosopumilaceae archaeon]
MAKRIVSFLPSATELLYELNADDMLYGVTHECLYPNDAKNKPRIIDSVFDPEKMSSQEIDQTTCSLLKDGKDIFTLNEKNLLDAKPDLIISQNTCEVCAAHTNQLSRATEILENKPTIHSMDPHNITEIFDGVIEIAKLIGKEKEGQKLKSSLEKRLEKIKNNSILEKPKVLALEWVDPLFTSGHWVPEMISIAGGINLVSKTGEHSRKMTLDEAIKSQPDYIIVMPCGFDTNRAVSEYNESLGKNESWKNLSAVKNNHVFAVDANSYFSKPSIRTVTGIEILAKILHPDIFTDIQVPENSYKVIE